VGIGFVSESQLRAIATDPDDDHVFILQSYLDAAGFVDILSATTCDGKSPMKISVVAVPAASSGIPSLRLGFPAIVVIMYLELNAILTLTPIL